MSGFDNIIDPCPHLPLPDTPADPKDKLAGVVEDIPGQVWTQFPWNESYISDPSWYDAVGRNYIVRKRIFMLPREEDQIKETLRVVDAFPNRGLNVMFKAAVDGKPHIIKALLDHGVKAHPAAPGEQEEGQPEDDHSLVPIHAAAFQGHLECVKLLVEQGNVDPDLCDVTGTPLQRAGMAGNAEIAQYLLSTGKVDVHREFTYKGEAKHPLEWIVRCGNSETATVLIDALLGGEDESSEVAKVLPASAFPEVAIDTAARSSDLGILQRLLRLRGLVDKDGAFIGPGERVVDDSNGHTAEFVLIKAISRAIAGVKKENVDYLVDIVGREKVLRSIEESADVREGYYMGLLDATAANDVSAFDYVAADLFAQDQVKKLPQSLFLLRWCLHEAASQDFLPMVKHLIEKYNVDINDTSPSERDVVPPIIAASIRGNAEMVKYLLEDSPARPDLALSSGQGYQAPPLWHAIRKSSAATVRLLLQHGAPVRFTPNQKLERLPDFVRIVASFDTSCPVRIYTDESSWDAANTPDKRGLIAGYVDVDASDEEFRAVVMGRCKASSAGTWSAWIHRWVKG